MRLDHDPVLIWTGLPEVGNRHHHQPRVAVAHRLVPDAQLGKEHRGVGLQEDIRTVSQFQQRFASLSGVDIHHNAALVGMCGHKSQTVPVMLGLRPP